MSEIQRRTGLSRPTLQKYKFEYADRIPSVGTGRTQRYPEEAVAVVLAIREENRSRVGRPSTKDSEGTKASPRKRGAQSASKGRGKGKSAKSSAGRTTKAKGKSAKDSVVAVQASPAARTTGLLTLTELARRVGVSLPTARRYVTDHLERISHVGEGRGKRFYEDAVATLRRIQKEAAGRRGRRGKGKVKAKEATKVNQASAKGSNVDKLVARLEALEARVVELERELERPLRLEIRR
ncbi:MAG: hypothetical protein K8J08_22515 [Thermoanaerobaculia bacterium]|nr:hypothetical protein [Thermoanaerobaculia bacterium]